MRILDSINDMPLRSVCLYLTPEQAESLVFAVQRLLDNPRDHHVHLNDDDYSHEITVTIYREDNLDTFNERSRKLIHEGE